MLKRLDCDVMEARRPSCCMHCHFTTGAGTRSAFVAAESVLGTASNSPRGNHEIRPLWKPRAGGSSADAQSGIKRASAAFAAWSPPKGITYHQFLSRLDSGGFAVVETDNPALVAEVTTKFGVWLNFEVVPVIDVGEIVPIAQEAIAFHDSVS
jgi:hypothetical protein